ncbi:acetyl-CoA carboxylase biotin carboxylase subunit [Salibacteraceae bacterium]|nr:acetyl-CoA carboxylase biotin carboxylase subunit [Salibacteraceae bacterium]
MKKILVANRGEIALRIMRTCKDMKISTLAVFSEVDRNAPFVRYADEAVCIGPAQSSESYLKIDRIIQAAKDFGADAIHPGYGFLSENPVFAEEVQKAGLILIGPSAHSMRIMGSKLAAKEAVSKYDIPMVPGTPGAIHNPEEAVQMAEQIGYPVLIKASAGGGGKGMRVVEKREELQEQIERAQSEARSAFGDDAVFVEKFVSKPRHIEFQVMCDSHGNGIHLFERECSIQRRHQKVIEEAPSSILTEAMRKEMGDCAIRVAKSCDYLGAGTVEFLIDDKLNYYFLEMNTRLQVEHPVTEMITGMDLVREQIEVARGKELSVKQEDLKIHGHSLEVRVYAEDPKENFLPATGTLNTYLSPKGPGVRLDDGFEEGMEIPIYYDPMISKLITHGSNRTEAIDRMLRAMDDYVITGVKTTIPFCRFAIDHKSFRSGDFDTNFVKQHFKPEYLDEQYPGEERAAAVLVNELLKQAQSGQKASNETGASKSNWTSNRKQY